MISIPPFCRRSLLTSANGGAVDHLDVAVVNGGNGVHHRIPYTAPQIREVAMPLIAKAFQSGNSQAIRLPKDLRFAVSETTSGSSAPGPSRT